MRKLIAIAIAGIACGGAKTSGLDKPKLSLLSTVPNPGGGLDRWAELHFTFSAPVDWAETQFARCVSGCRASLVPFRFVSTGTEVVGTPLLPTEFGASYTVRVTPLFAQAADNGDLGANIDFDWSTLPPATTVSSDVTADTTLTIGGSPYYFAPGIKVRAALTVAPGVEVAGDVAAAGSGSVTAVGTPAQHVRISNAVFAAPGRLSYVDMLGAVSVSAQDVDHADVEGARLANAVVLRISGSISDSRVTDVAVPSLHGQVARNTFLRCLLELGGSAPGNAFGISSDSVTEPPAAWDASTSFTNNYVSAGQAWLTPSAGAISGNTFAGADHTTLWSTYPENYTTPANLSGNYWSGAGEATVATYFRPAYRVYLDRANPMLGLAPEPPTPALSPILAAADPTAPTP